MSTDRPPDRGARATRPAAPRRDSSAASGNSPRHAAPRGLSRYLLPVGSAPQDPRHTRAEPGTRRALRLGAAAPAVDPTSFEALVLGTGSGPEGVSGTGAVIADRTPTASQPVYRPTEAADTSAHSTAGPTTAAAAPSTPAHAGTEPAASAPHSATGTIRHAAARSRGQRLQLVAAAVLALAVFVTSGMAWAYRDLNANIQSHDIDALLGSDEDRPATSAAPDPEDPHAGRALNVVLIGTDDRSGDNRDLGGGTTPGVRSDTVIVAHVSADRERVEMVSIPRDSWVTIPSCELPDGTATEPREGKFNGAFELGGQTGDVGYAAACTIRTIESLTDVRMDGFIAVDFAGFVNVVDALDGIPFCVPEPINDRQAHVELEAGQQVLTGEEALGFARVRKTLGDGSDTQRIGRQQDLLAATARHALDQNLLTDGTKLYGFLDAATSSVTASEGFASISSLAGLGYSIRGIDPGDITFTTVPWVDRGDGANVLWTQEATELWQAIGEDRPLQVADDEAADGEEGPDGEGAAGEDGGGDSIGAEEDGGTDGTGQTSDDEDTTGPSLEGSTAAEQNGPCG